MDSGPGEGDGSIGNSSKGDAQKKRKSVRKEVQDVHDVLGPPIQHFGRGHPPFGVDVLRRYVQINQRRTNKG